MLSTLCYIRYEDEYLMLYRNGKKKNDVNQGKWIGVGGKFLPKETPKECLLRECKEETGIVLEEYIPRGIITFIYDQQPPEYIFLYEGIVHSKTITPCNEGHLEWIHKDDIFSLDLWEGDRIFLKEFLEKDSFIDIGLTYDQWGNLIKVS